MHILWYFNQFLLHWTIAFSRHTVKVSNKLFSLNSKKLWRNLWRNSITKPNCDGIPSQIVTDFHHSVTICDGKRPIRHKIVTDSVTILPSVTKRTFRRGVPPSKIVTDLPSQTDCDGKCPSQFFRQKIVTDEFPSQIVTDPSQLYLWRMKLWRTVFRHNFRHKLNFPSQFHKFSVTISVTNCDFSGSVNILKTVHTYLNVVRHL